MYDDIKEDKFWVQYHCLDIRGLIYFIKGNRRIQVTTDHKVYFYLIDKESLMPVLENVMFNFMNCSQMMFGPKVKFCITYKNNERGFDVYTRKFTHGLKINVIKEDLEGSHGLHIESMNAFIISKIDTIRMYDSQTYQEMEDHSIKIKLLESTTKEENEIISM